MPTREGWLYLAVTIDLFSRKIVGWTMSDALTSDLVFNALGMTPTLQHASKPEPRIVVCECTEVERHGEGFGLAGLLLQSTIGFGSALIAMPLLSGLLGIHAATAIVGIVSVASSLLITIIDRRHIDLRQSWRLTLASVLGVPVGLYLLHVLPEGIILKGLGAVLIFYSVFSLLTASRQLHSTRNIGWLAWPLGFVSGVLGGAYNTNGPPLVVFGALHRWPPQQFRATLQSVFFTSGIVIALGQFASGLWTQQALLLSAMALPAIPVAVLLGRHLNKRISPALFTRLLHVVLIALGARLLLG